MKKARTFANLGKRAGLLVTVATGASLLAGSALAQMYEKPYGFATRDRAGLAVYMKNLEESRKKKSSSTTGVGTATYLVCGGGGGSSATSTANSSCIILNNSDAALGIGQDSAGDQDANAETESTTTTADEVSNILNQSTTTAETIQ